MEVLRLGVDLELQLLAYTIATATATAAAIATATATLDPSHVCDVHHSSWQCWILNPRNKGRDQTCLLMDTSQVLNSLSHSRTPKACAI